MLLINRAGRKINKSNKGFTIVELMIATSIFGVILIVAASGVIAIGRIYYKGITSSKAQETSRSIIDTISRTIQFTGQPISTGSDASGAQSLCFGEDRYSYTIDQPVTGSADLIGLKYDKRTDLSTCAPIEPDDPAGSELLPENIRLLDLRVTSINPELFKINVKVAYGDNDLLTHYPANADETSPPTAPPASGLCRPSIVGGNFCATSELETIVNKRVK
ncbi:MAG TPA: prepilin-type N-terminal cleavage/methylation domain-containing protein [Candidatus Saccharimonadales bacterium]|nr:prepilin-type N-terminal cleavage/methylation domain-containing protein [Candidatus Saccharimonadales bacterium]